MRIINKKMHTKQTLPTYAERELSPHFVN
jgi:hypothetical protein